MPRKSGCESDIMQIEDTKKDVDIHMREAPVKRVTRSTRTRISSKMRKKNGRPRILGEEHKKMISAYIDEKPSAFLEQLMERLLQRFEMKDSSPPKPVDRNSEEIIQERLDWIRKWEGPTWISGPTASSLATMDEMGQYPHMKGYYLVMDNAPIHKSDDIATIKHNRFLEQETLMTRITEAADSLKVSELHPPSIPRAFHAWGSEQMNMSVRVSSPITSAPRLP
ncbi:hypothetical protein VTP01DRAFT_423 [Rhizomucor pusillus]|uniref:uncharacterized protein n=1 Tax=Rhizomucor pusillus TaxID=4840 RepID=UPI0037421B43